ncbi:hypothetical protein OIU85_011687 [Salix viminalis]|uniref:Reverse transcriptase zinc-binding domain-containing protein n=1 Tax=Salix viminalis TaxID=40686 RepID=A0A9Q0NTA6_SALVM|nr:hypothetical protein OIU85_011687 [Salix viminalis]
MQKLVLSSQVATGISRLPTLLQSTWDIIRSQPSPSHADSHVWPVHPSGKFTIASEWELLRDKKPVPQIHHLLWFPDHVPRQSTSIQGRITRAVHPLRHHLETHNHLFFECTYSRTVWHHVNQKAGLPWPTLTPTVGLPKMEAQDSFPSSSSKTSAYLDLLLHLTREE